MKKLENRSKTAGEIKALIKSKQSYPLGARLVSILPLAMGQSSRQAQELLLLSHNQICIWSKRFEKDGLEGLRDKPKTGRKPRINQTQLNWLENLVLNESPTNYKFNTATWTAPLLVELLLREWNLHYSDDSVYNILKKKLGFTHKKGKGFYKESDKEKRTEFVEGLKKTLRKSKQ